MSTISKVRRGSYRLGRDLGNLQSINRAIETKSPSPLVKRALRRSAYKHTSHTLNRMLRKAGLF